MSMDDARKRLERLAEVLDVHGPRQERWPDAIRAELSAFVRNDRAAARLVAEARALDKVLTFAPKAPAGKGLEARILVAASRLPQQPQQDSVVAFPRKPGSAALVAREAKLLPQQRIWPEMTLLAASLFIGLLIGLSGQALPTLQDIAVLADDDGALGSIAGLLFDPGGTSGRGAL